MPNLPATTLESVVPAAFKPMPFDAAYQEYRRQEKWHGHETAKSWLFERSGLPERGMDIVWARVRRENVERNVHPWEMFNNRPRKELGL